MKSKMNVSDLSVKPGDCIKLKGKVDPEAKSFLFNLGRNDSDLVLHFNARFDSLGDIKTIVCNSKEDGEWGMEWRESIFPFQKGEDTKICISFHGEEIKVKMNGDHEITFPNRLGLKCATSFSVEGDISIQSVKFC